MVYKYHIIMGKHILIWKELQNVHDNDIVGRWHKKDNYKTSKRVTTLQKLGHKTAEKKKNLHKVFFLTMKGKADFIS